MEQNQSTVNNNQKTKLPLISISELFKQSFSFYFSNFFLIFKILLLPFVLISLGQFILPSTPLPALGVLLIGILFTILAPLALILIISNKATSFFDSYKQAIKLFFPFLWISILSELPLFGGFIFFFIPSYILTILIIVILQFDFRSIIFIHPQTITYVSILGIFILPLIPTIILTIYFYFIFYVFVVENKRGLSALVQSWYYVKGYWWNVLGRVLFLMVLIFFISPILRLMIGFFPDTLPPLIILEWFSDLLNVDYYVDYSRAGLILNFFYYFFLIPFTFIYSYLLYNSLKQVKPEQPSEDEERKIKRYIIFLCRLGIIVIILFIFLLWFLDKTIEY